MANDLLYGERDKDDMESFFNGVKISSMFGGDADESSETVEADASYEEDDDDYEYEDDYEDVEEEYEDDDYEEIDEEDRYSGSDIQEDSSISLEKSDTVKEFKINGVDGSNYRVASDDNSESISSVEVIRRIKLKRNCSEPPLP